MDGSDERQHRERGGEGARARRDIPNARTATDVEALKRAFLDHLQYSQGADEHSATAHDRYLAVAYSVRDRMMRRWIQTQQAYYREDAKQVYYLSLEFLMGRALENNLLNVGLYEPMRAGLKDLGLDLADLLAQEPDAGLGNGGLGRLAACFLDSLATLRYPATGYGIRYEFGIFDQEIRNGYQVERPEEWLRFGNAWEIPRPESVVPVALYGRIEHGADERGRHRARWVDARHVLGMPYDVPITGFRNDTVNTLRLWRARASQELDLADFNAGDYLAAVEDKFSENISKVLYPNDLTVMGKELRLQQQYFFVCCSIHDIVQRLRTHDDLRRFPDKVAIQLNEHAPRRRHRRAHARPRGRARARVGRGVGDLPRHVRLHEPHAHAGGARGAGRSTCSAACCRGTSRSSTRSTGGSSRGSAPRAPPTSPRSGG